MKLKKLSNEFSRTESHILGALSKLDEILLNPQVRTCSVAVPGTSRNSDSENRETSADRSSDDPCPEAMFSCHHSGNLNGSELEGPITKTFCLIQPRVFVSSLLNGKRLDRCTFPKIVPTNSSLRKI